MNEWIFLLHLCVVALFLMFAMKLGKEALSFFVVFSFFSANFFVVKQIDLFGLHLTASDLYGIASIISLNIVQELYGKKLANKLIWLSFFFLSCFLIYSQIHLWYLPSRFDVTHDAFVRILSYGPRIVSASLLVYFIAQKINMHLFAYITKHFKKNLSQRLIIASATAQLFDTIAFTLIALYGNVANVWHIIAVSYVIKLCMILFTSPLAHLFKTFTKVEDNA